MDAHQSLSPAQAFTSEEGVTNARSRILSGCSVINVGFYSRANPDFYAKSDLDWYLRMMNQLWTVGSRVNPYNHFKLEHVSGTKIGGFTCDSSDRRHNAADLLEFAIGLNIKVDAHANIERNVLAPTSASDAAIGSKPYLSSWGIPFSDHLPYAGQFLYDDPRNGISIVHPMPLKHFLIQAVGITESRACLEAASNAVPFAVLSRLVFTRSPTSPLYLTVASMSTT
ncbi:(R)-mandelonitrile lyase-like [Bienertia sinuspersici]